jgi:hypothetical protein
MTQMTKDYLLIRHGGNFGPGGSGGFKDVLGATWFIYPKSRSSSGWGATRSFLWTAHFLGLNVFILVPFDRVDQELEISDGSSDWEVDSSQFNHHIQDLAAAAQWALDHTEGACVQYPMQTLP